MWSAFGRKFFKNFYELKGQYVVKKSFLCSLFCSIVRITLIIQWFTEKNILDFMLIRI